MIRRMDGRPATIAEIRRRQHIRALVAEQLDVRPECDECASEACVDGKCLRMAEATIAQARLVIHDLTHALRDVAPDHPVLEDCACFVWSGE
jgi:hypothetical protein